MKTETQQALLMLYRMRDQLIGQRTMINALRPIWLSSGSWRRSAKLAVRQLLALARRALIEAAWTYRMPGELEEAADCRPEMLAFRQAILLKLSNDAR